MNIKIQAFLISLLLLLYVCPLFSVGLVQSKNQLPAQFQYPSVNGKISSTNCSNHSANAFCLITGFEVLKDKNKEKPHPFVMQSVDGGHAWKKLLVSDLPPGIEWSSISCTLDKNLCMAPGYDPNGTPWMVIAQSTDQLQSWQLRYIDLPSFADPNNRNFRLQTSCCSGKNANSLCFAGGGSIETFGRYVLGAILVQSRDQGKSWENVNSFTGGAWDWSECSMGSEIEQYIVKGRVEGEIWDPNTGGPETMTEETDDSGLVWN